jgi:cation transport regulator
MTYQQLEDLPQEVTDKLPKHGQQLFMAAYNAVLDNGMNERNATKVAWDSVKNSYQEDKDGNWISIENSTSDRGNIIGTDKDTSDPIGNRENNTGTMRGG